MTEIDADGRLLVERRRLLRMFDAISREPSAGEQQRLRALVKTINPKAAPDELFVGMRCTALTHENKDRIDVKGFASLSVIGIHCQMARVSPSNVLFGTRRGAPGPLPEQLIRHETNDQCDTMLFVTRDQRVRAVERVLVQTENKRLMLDGQLCLRKIELSEEERLRVNTAHNVHARDYLDYFTYADEAAARGGADIMSDEHQRQYDKYYELVYAAFDCLLVHTRRINDSYLQRITLVHNLTETPVAENSSTAFKRRAAVAAAVDYAGGAHRLQLTVFLKPLWSVKHIRAAMHAVPACLQGIAIDGVVFNPNESSYAPGVNGSLLKYSPHPMIDLLVAKLFNGVPALWTREGGKHVLIPAPLIMHTESARRLLRNLPPPPVIVRCRGVHIEDDEYGWCPVLVCTDKKVPDSLAQHGCAMAALKNVLEEEELIDYVVRRQTNAVSAQ